jgi:hypothetical protein
MNATATAELAGSPESVRSDRQPPVAGCGQSRQSGTGWCQPLALNEDRLDEPGYRPYSRWRPAVGAGPAPDLHPAQQCHPTPPSPAAARPAAAAINASTCEQQRARSRRQP